MPIIEAARRKRSRSNSKSMWFLPRGSKVRVIEPAHYDATCSRRSTESASPSRTQMAGMKAKLRRGGSVIRTFFSRFSQHSDEPAALSSENSTMTVQRHGSKAPVGRIKTRVELLPNLRLIGTPDATTKEIWQGLQDALQESDDTANDFDMCGAHTAMTNSQLFRRSNLHKSQSVPGLTHRLSHKLSEVFGNPTVVHRTTLRSRPSIYSAASSRDPHVYDSTQVPSPATYNGSSGSPTNGGHSTPPTSDGTPITPVSATHGFNTEPSTEPSLLGREGESTRLPTISEATAVELTSITTVEATANTKIFFETHFDSVYSGTNPRMLRRQELEKRLSFLKIPREARKRARDGFLRQENEFLRLARVSKTKLNGTGISIAGYDVVKILGKGSFGVVRLVKEKTNKTKLPDTSSSGAGDLVPAPAHSGCDLVYPKISVQGLLETVSKRHRRYDLTKLKKEVYAMKVIRKSDMIRNSQEGHLRAERDFLVASEGSIWVVPLISAFQDRKNLYLVMEYCIGGDFLGLLIRKNTLSEDVARWYIAEMILCVEEAHKLRWIHRDVKPDNFLIGADGHLKISDFGLSFDGSWRHDQQYLHQTRHSLIETLGLGLVGDEQDQQEEEQNVASHNIGRIIGGLRRPCDSKRKLVIDLEKKPDGEPILDWRNAEQRRKLARSVVGTSQYMAPEVVRGELYDGRCDWWSIGIILYECLYGHTPFACENRQDTKLRILRWKETLEFPQFPQSAWSVGKEGEMKVRRQVAVSDEVIDLMAAILREKERRLCSRKYAVNDFTRKMVGELQVKCVVDKQARDYQGHFVYPEDADQIKRHPWFRKMKWDAHSMLSQRPPFVPRVNCWEDTKYFDDPDEDPVSDISDDSSNEDNAIQFERAEVDDPPGIDTNEPSFKVSHHQHEDQKIVPSRKMDAVDEVSCVARCGDASELDNAEWNLNEVTKRGDTGNPPMFGHETSAHHIDGASPGHLPACRQESHRIGTFQPKEEPRSPPPAPTAKKERQEKRRPRDKILRDAEHGARALEMRRRGAFLGYEFRRRRKAIDELVKDGVMEEYETKRKEAWRSGIVNGSSWRLDGGT